MTERKDPTLLQALIPVLFLIVLLSINVGIFKDSALDGSNQIVLIFSAAVAAIVAARLGFKWLELRKGIVKSISSAMSSILILLLIGALTGTWLLSGVVPAMIYYGLQILNPTIFLFAACIVCAIVSIATGSSWTTAATVGIALIGIGKTLGLSEGMIAGAVLSGAYFGDKMSPLSDTTNLAPAMAGTDLFTHIRYMTITTIPSITITLVIFLIIGFFGTSEKPVETDLILKAIEDRFYISGVLFLVPAAVVFLITRKVAAIPSLLVGILLGALFAIIFQPDLVAHIGGGKGVTAQYIGIMKSMYGKIGIETTDPMINELLQSKGMGGMLSTIWLILSAMVFGGVMETAGFLRVIAQSILKLVNSTGSLITSTVGTCVFFNITASDQYLAIVVPGRMYADIYRDKKLAPENLSRSLEDSGTVTSVLIPWNTCGAYHSSVLNVSTLTYLPYCFFNIISPIMSIFMAYAGIKIKKLVTTEKA
ncbi:MAG: Na+/H+ antiporter NhaC [Cyclobacteriaceae bacterium]